MADPAVVLAATQRGWAARLRAHAADHGGVLVRATVLTPEDALDEPAAVVLLDDITSFLTAGFVAALHDRDRAVLGLHEAADAAGAALLEAAGVDVVLPADVEPDVLVAHAARLAARRPARAAAHPPRAAAPGAAGRGRVVGVLGPTGGVGVTEVAVELAAATAAAGTPAALVDADEWGPAVAQRLGLAVHPNLHAGLEAVARGGPPLASMHALSVRAPLQVLPGMPAPDGWESVRPGLLDELLVQVAATTPVVVVDLGHAPGRVEGPTGTRCGHALQAAARCDALVLVASPTPSAVARAIAIAARLPRDGDRLHVALNRARRDRFGQAEAAHELQRATGAPTRLLAEDEAVGVAAWQGRRVARGRFRRDVRALAEDLGTIAAGRAGGGRVRRAG